MVPGGVRLTSHQTKVDLDDFKAWLCDCPAGTFGPNGSYCHSALLGRG